METYKNIELAGNMSPDEETLCKEAIDDLKQHYYELYEVITVIRVEDGSIVYQTCLHEDGGQWIVYK